MQNMQTLTCEPRQAAMDPTLSTQEAIGWAIDNLGFPTFEEFSKDPDKWRTNKNEIFDSIENLNVYFKNRVKRVKYLWRGKYKCKTLGSLYDVASREGYSGDQVEMEPIAMPMDGTSNLHNTRIEITVNVWPKDEFRARGGIVAND
jgi:hypothetical protein